jgi:signal peptide peptidase SppA
MLHARIAARAFNTPLLVDPSKALAFVSGLGPRILGRRVDVADQDGVQEHVVTPAARASILVGGLAEAGRTQGEAPYPVMDGIAVIEISGMLIHRGSWIGQSSGQTSYEGIGAQIEAAARDPSIRAVALEIDSFGGEVAGVFDLADRIRTVRATKPVWAFVAEHALSAGYALASQADRILLPRTGAVGSIGVVVMHADLSGQLDQDGMRITLVHSGQHKIDGNPYAPLPEAVRDDIQREIDVLRVLFAETVAAGRAGRLSQEAALATEATTYRGAEAVTAGLADEVTDLARGFAAFRQSLGGMSSFSTLRAPRASILNPRQEARMATEHDPEDSKQDSVPDVTTRDGNDTDAVDRPTSPLATPPSTIAHSGLSSVPPFGAAQSSNLAELSAELREAAAEIAEIAVQAGRLGVAIDAAKALREGTVPEVLRKSVLQSAAAAADARDIVAAPPSPVLPKAAESPIIAAAKRAAAAGARG